MATVTRGRTFVSGEVVTPTKLNALVDSATVTQIVDADVSASAGISDTKLATIATAGKVSNSATTATSANTANAIVARDASGNFSAGTITASVFAGVGATLLVPPGAVMPFAMNVAPSGWLEANGSAVSRTTYAALFAAIGTLYGAGDGSTTFALPDLRGYFVRGSGTNGNGVASSTFGVKQTDAFQGHFHSATTTAVRLVGGGSVPTGGNYGFPAAAVTVSGATTDGTNGTPRIASETRPVNIAMLYCIKF
jgi:microcystin-dependent protein